MTGNKNEPKAVQLVDKLGRIQLPAEARRFMDWEDGVPIEIWMDPAGGQIVLKKHIPACACCGQTEELKPFHRKHICTGCLGEIAKL